MAPETNEEVFDLIVIGGGGSGLTAALAAAQFGSKVLVIEASSGTGGHTSMTQGMFPAAGARIQLENVLDISPEQVFSDIMKANGNSANKELVMQLCRYSGETVDWLVSYVGQPMYPVTEFRYYGYSVSSIVAPGSRTGAELTSSLQLKAESNENILIVKSRRCLLSLDSRTGKVLAEIVGTGERIHGRKYVVAAGGFGANRDMVSRYLPEAGNLLYFGSSDHDGTAVKIAKELGLRLDFMDSYQAHSSVSATGNLLSWESVLKGSIIVNSSGRRFAEERVGYSEFASKIMNQDGGYAYEIIPDHVYREMVALYQEFRAASEQGGIMHMKSPREISEFIGCSQAAIDESLSQFLRSSYVQGEKNFPQNVLPFHVAKIYPALFHTLGGIATDRYLRAVRENGSISSQVYAVGDSAAGISGHGAGGYLSGSGLLMAIVGGYIAGRHAVGNLK